MLPLLLVLLPLDLHAAGPTPEAASLQVRLELVREGYSTRYRITHQYRGARPMRFVTGSTDRNCDQPIDALVVDGKVMTLSSMLPCGGFAFRASRLLKPGEQWTLAGVIGLTPGPHQVAARYCATAADLGAVAPAERQASEPAWWLHCADSATVRLESSPDDAWLQLLAALRAGDSAAIGRLTTSAGLASLRAGARGEPEATAFARWGKGWAGWEIRWRSRTADRAEAWLGPQSKEHGLVFVRTGADWRLERWSPGE